MEGKKRKKNHLSYYILLKVDVSIATTREPSISNVWNTEWQLEQCALIFLQ